MRLEVVSAIHRKNKERLTSESTRQICIQPFGNDSEANCWIWHALDDHLISVAGSAYQSLSSAVFIRASGALDLASAQQYGFREIYSNDSHLLTADTYFGSKSHQPQRQKQTKTPAQLPSFWSLSPPDGQLNEVSGITRNAFWNSSTASGVGRWISTLEGWRGWRCRKLSE